MGIYNCGKETQNATFFTRFPLLTDIVAARKEKQKKIHLPLGCFSETVLSKSEWVENPFVATNVSGLTTNWTRETHRHTL